MAPRPPAVTPHPHHYSHNTMLIKLEATRIPGIKALMKERGLSDVDAAVDAALADFLERVGMDREIKWKEEKEEHTRAGAKPEEATAPALNRDSSDYRQGVRHAQILNAQNEDIARRLTRPLPGSR
jgi:hypothetical protein